MNETIGEALTIIAEKAGHGIEYVYPLLVDVQVVLGIRDIAVPLIALGVGYYVYVKTFKAAHEQGKDRTYYTIMESVGVGIMAGVCAGLLVGMMVHCIFDGMIRILNPEYYALKEILTAVKG